MVQRDGEGCKVTGKEGHQRATQRIQGHLSVCEALSSIGP